MAFLEEYTLLDELGQGGYATVYKVRHNHLGYIRAIRVLNATIAHGEADKTYQKFLQECRLLLRLGNGNHPNIVHIYQPLLKAQKAIVEMDYVDGMDLYHYLKEHNGFVPTEDVFRLLTGIGSALAYCHNDIYRFCMDKEDDNLKDDPADGTKVLLDDSTIDRLVDKYRVIHNDIHSGNIIRREDGNFVLLDFGLAIEGNDVVRSSRKRNGAPEFKAPEKWDNESLLTTQSDIYSFGVVLYEYLTGRVPFPFDKKNSNPSEAEYLLGKAHKEQLPPPILGLRKAAFEQAHPEATYEKDYPDWLEEVVMRCLEKSPADRFKDGKELHNFVKKCISRDSDAKVERLRDEIDLLKNKISCLEHAKTDVSREHEECVADLRRQIDEAQGRIEKLTEERQSLQAENEELRDSRSGSVPTPDMEEMSRMKQELKRLETELGRLVEEHSRAKGHIARLEEENASLRKVEPGRPRSSKAWKFLTLLFLLTTVAMAVMWYGSVNPLSAAVETLSVAMDDGSYETYSADAVKKLVDNNKDLSLKNTSLSDLLANYESTSTVDNSDVLQKLNAQIVQKDSLINELNKTVDELKKQTVASNTNDNSQSVIRQKDKEIRSLNSTISSLKNQIKEKDRLIAILKEELVQ